MTIELTRESVLWTVETGLKITATTVLLTAIAYHVVFGSLVTGFVQGLLLGICLTVAGIGFELFERDVSESSF